MQLIHPSSGRSHSPPYSLVAENHYVDLRKDYTTIEHGTQSVCSLLSFPFCFPGHRCLRGWLKDAKNRYCQGRQRHTPDRVLDELSPIRPRVVDAVEIGELLETFVCQPIKAVCLISQGVQSINGQHGFLRLALNRRLKAKFCKDNDNSPVLIQLQAS